MFQTEELQNLVNQLKNGQNLGYFQCLGLIIQIIGYFLVPISIMIVTFLLVHILTEKVAPNFLANRVQEENKAFLKRYATISNMRKKEKKEYLRARQFLLEDYCIKYHTICRLVKYIVCDILGLFLVSPFFFASTLMTIKEGISAFVFLLFAISLITWCRWYFMDGLNHWPNFWKHFDDGTVARTTHFQLIEDSDSDDSE